MIRENKPAIVVGLLVLTFGSAPPTAMLGQSTRGQVAGTGLTWIQHPGATGSLAARRTPPKAHPPEIPSAAPGNPVASNDRVAPKTEAERLVVAAVKAGFAADLSGIKDPKDRHLSGAFVASFLAWTPEADVPSHRIVIRNAEIDGPFEIEGGNSSGIRYDVVLDTCTLHGGNLDGVRFDHSLAFINATLQGNLALNLVQVKGDLALDLSGQAGSSISMANTRVDGLTLMVLQDVSVDAETMATKDFIAIAQRVPKLTLSQIDAESVRITGGLLTFSVIPREGRHLSPAVNIDLLDLQRGRIKGELLLDDIRISKLLASGLQVAGHTGIFSSAAIDREINLSAANLGFFDWQVHPCENNRNLPCWPLQATIEGLGFRDLRVEIPKDTPTSACDMERRPSIGDGRSASLCFLKRATFSEAPFIVYEQILTGGGMTRDADDVYVAMRHGRRRARVRDSGKLYVALVGVPYFAMDLLQEWLLGYGRDQSLPLLWSGLFILVGCLRFTKNAGMQSQCLAPPAYSPFWYSLELFVPLVEFGMAKSWSPPPRLRNLARMHQLAGWILVPAVLAALTGAVK